MHQPHDSASKSQPPPSCSPLQEQEPGKHAALLRAIDAGPRRPLYWGIRAAQYWSLLAIACIPAPLPGQEWRDLFNGKDLTGWVAEGVREYKDKDGSARPQWTVQEGRLVCAGRGFGFLRYDRQQFGDFVLHVEYRMSPKGNSGIGIRTGPFDPARSRETRPSFFSYEIQLLDDAGKPPNAHGSGSLYRYVAPKANPVKPAGEWNTVEVTAQGPRIQVAINGVTIIDVDQRTIEAIKNKPLKGYVCLQSHTNQVEFRSVRIRELGNGAAPTASPSK